MPQTTAGYRCDKCGQTALMHPWDTGVPECGGTVEAPHAPATMQCDESLDGPARLPEPDQRPARVDDPTPEEPPSAEGSREVALGAGAEEPAE